MGRWNCHELLFQLRVTQGTLFQGSKVPLQKSFLATLFIFSAKKSISSHQLVRDLDLNQKTAWYVLTHIRRAMKSEEKSILVGIVEADETYVGGKPRKGNKRDNNYKHRGLGRTTKMPAIGLVERGGKLVAKMVDNVSGGRMKEFIFLNVNIRN